MPVEIKELVIRAVAQQSGQEQADSGSASGASSSSHEERAAIVEAAVKEVLRILRAAKER